MNFDKAFQFTIAAEGVYSNHPNDLGGETFMGIARNYWDKWIGWPIIDSMKGDRNFPNKLKENVSLMKLVKEFYRSNFWDPIKGDIISTYSEEVAAEVFDCAVNMSVKRACYFLQESLNVFNRNEKLYKDLFVDGLIGNKSLEALDTYFDNDTDEVLLKALLIKRGNHYLKRTKEDSSQEVFIRGWLNRIQISKLKK